MYPQHPALYPHIQKVPNKGRRNVHFLSFIYYWKWPDRCYSIQHTLLAFAGSWGHRGEPGIILTLKKKDPAPAPHAKKKKKTQNPTATKRSSWKSEEPRPSCVQSPDSLPRLGNKEARTNQVLVHTYLFPITRSAIRGGSKGTLARGGCGQCLLGATSPSTALKLWAAPSPVSLCFQKTGVFRHMCLYLCIYVARMCVCMCKHECIC